MHWFIPAKTFLLGEYLALTGQPALLITTKPCFKLVLTQAIPKHPVHPDSPAGSYWRSLGHCMHLSWHDPYDYQGGLGASSAQFIGAYLAHCYLTKTKACVNALLNSYYQFAYTGNHIQPSGYDVIAQSQYQCVYINKQKNHIQCSVWPFNDIGFILIHTGQKLATHVYLQTITDIGAVKQLMPVIAQAIDAWQTVNTLDFINGINAYQQVLTQYHLTTAHSLAILNQLAKYPDLLAAKGCGAMGADVILLIVNKTKLVVKIAELQQQGLKILATSNDLYNALPVIKK